MIKKEVFIGFLVAIITTIFGFYLYVELMSTAEFETTLKVIIEEGFLGKIIGLSALPNLLVFFIFLKKKQEYRARGVVLACIALAIIILGAQFI